MKRSSSQINASALLIGLITLVSLGSVATASVGAAMIAAPERATMVREEREGESVARLILSLTDAAKRLHGQTHTIAPDARFPGLASREPATFAAPPPPCVPNAQALGDARLIDLPPPAL